MQGLFNFTDMKYLLACCFIMMLFNKSYAQAENEDDRLVKIFLKNLPKTLKYFGLKDLRDSKDTLNIRIWQQGIINLNSTNPNYQICISGEERTCKVFEIPKSTSTALMKTLISLNLFKLKNDSYRGIDGTDVTIEIVHDGIYRAFSYWSPNAKRNETSRNVFNILNTVNQKLNINDLNTRFLQTLKPGTYPWDMTSIYIDRFLSNNVKKTDFYLVVKNRIKLELNVDENSSATHFPLILINNSKAQISDLNKYSNKDLIECNILKPGVSSSNLYGARANYGVVLVKMKKKI